MSFRAWFFVIVVASVGLVLGTGVKFKWGSPPLSSEILPPVEPTIVDTNPAQPVTTCIAYGFKQDNLNMEYVIKRTCKVEYKR